MSVLAEEAAHDSAGEPESPFEEDVLRAVRSLGYDATPQVGVAGYRIDIGVRHPTQPGTYALGVECDGVAYHSSKVARDRDRLRQEVLQNLGWTIHRIWGTAWHLDRAAEIRRLQRAIEEAVDGSAPKVPTRPSAEREPEVVIDEFDFDEWPEWAWAYTEPDVPAPKYPGEFQDPGARREIARQIRGVVEACGPVHRERVLELVREAWGLGRSGGRIQAAFREAVGMLVSRGDVEEDSGFLSVPGAPVQVRVAEDELATPRKVSRVAPEELGLAVRNLLADARIGVPYDELRTHWARLFGWRRVGAEIEAAFDDLVDALVANGVAVRAGRDLRLAEDT